MNKSFTKIAARTVSTVFIPPVIALGTFIYIALRFEITTKNKLYVIAVASFFGFIFQILSFLYFLKKGFISDLDAKIKSQRILPYWYSLFLFITGIIFLLSFSVSSISIAFWFCYITNTFLVILINNFFKISIHAMGVASSIALFTYLNNVLAIALMPILVIVGWARWKLKIHTRDEIVFGALVGFISVYFQLLILLG